MITLPDPAAAVPPALHDPVPAWYDAGGHRLAFRATRDPYAVLVSELMAQQTQACCSTSHRRGTSDPHSPARGD